MNIMMISSAIPSPKVLRGEYRRHSRPDDADVTCGQRFHLKNSSLSFSLLVTTLAAYAACDILTFFSLLRLPPEGVRYTLLVSMDIYYSMCCALLENE